MCFSIKKSILLLGAFLCLIISSPAQEPELITAMGHEEMVVSVEISPDGKLLATADLGGVTKIWDLHTGVNRYTLKGYPPIRFTKEGDFLVVNKRDTRPGWFSLEPKRSQLLFISTEDWQVKDKIRKGDLSQMVEMHTYSLIKKKSKLVMKPHKKGLKRKSFSHKGYPLMNACISLDGRYLAMGWGDGSLLIYDPRTEAILRPIRGYRMYAQNGSFPCKITKKEYKYMRFSRGGNYLLFGNDEQLSVADIDSGFVTFKHYLKADDYLKMGAVCSKNQRQRSRMYFINAQNGEKIDWIDIDPNKKETNQAVQLEGLFPDSLKCPRYPASSLYEFNIALKKLPSDPDSLLGWDQTHQTVRLTAVLEQKLGKGILVPSGILSLIDQEILKPGPDIARGQGFEFKPITYTPDEIKQNPELAFCFTCNPDSIKKLPLLFQPLNPDYQNDTLLSVFEKGFRGNDARTYRYYGALYQGKYHYPDTLLTIAFDRADSNLLTSIYYNNEEKKSRRSDQDFLSQIFVKFGFKDLSDSLKFRIFELGKERGEERKILKRTRTYLGAPFKMDPSETKLVFLGAPDSLITYDLIGDSLLSSQKIPTSSITDFSFSEDARYLATSSNDQYTYLWHQPEMTHVRTFCRTTFPSNEVMFNENFSGLMTGDFSKNGGGGNLWNLATGEKVGFIETLDFSWNQMAFDKTGRLFLSEGIGESPKRFETRLVDITLRREVHLPVKFGLMEQIHLIDSSMQIILTGGAHDHGLIQSKPLENHVNQKPTKVEGGRILSSKISPDGRILFAGGMGGIFLIGNLQRQNAFKTIQVEGGDLHALALHPHKPIVALGSADGHIRFYDYHDHQFSDTPLKTAIPIKLLSYSKDGRQLALADWEDHIKVFYGEGFTKVKEMDWHDERISSMKFSHDGQHLLIQTEVGHLAQSGNSLRSSSLYSVESGEKDRRFLPKDSLQLPVLMDLHPDSSVIIVGGYYRKIKGYNLETGRLLFTSNETGKSAKTLKYAPDGQTFFTSTIERDSLQYNQLRGTTEGSKIYQWDALNGRKIRPLGLVILGGKPGRAEVSSFLKVKDMTFSLKQNYLLVSHWNGSFTVFDLKNGEPVKEIHSRTDFFYSLTYFGGSFYHYYNSAYSSFNQDILDLLQKIPSPGPSYQNGSGRLETNSRIPKTGGRLKKNNQSGTRLSAQKKQGESSRIGPSKHQIPSQKRNPLGFSQTGETDKTSKDIADNQGLLKTAEQIQLRRIQEFRNFPGILQKKANVEAKKIVILTKNDSTGLYEKSLPFEFEKFKKTIPNRGSKRLFKGGLFATGLRLRKKIKSTHSYELSRIRPSNDKETFLSTGNDTQVILWDKETKEAKLQMVSSYDNAGHIMFNSDGNYLVTKNAASMIAFGLGIKMYPFEVFDLHMNRPDLVVKDLPNQDSTVVHAFYQSYLRRLRRMGEDSLSGDIKLEIPELSIDNPRLSPAMTERDIPIKVSCHDPAGNSLIRLQAWVNDVPLFGLDGLDLRSRQSNRLDTTIMVRLNEGANKIQFTAINSLLNASLKETIQVKYIGTSQPKTLYVVCIGVSAYPSGISDLQFPATDARYLAAFLRDNAGHLYDSVKPLVLEDAEVGSGTLEQIAQFLADCKEDDRVLLFMSGHGENDPLDYEYYFLSPQFDGLNYQQGGISFQRLEKLLAAVKSRNKFLILNTCMSGEVDQESSPIQAGEDFIIMNQMFLDLRRSSGTTVLASSSGYGYVQEAQVEGTKHGPMVNFLTNFLKNCEEKVSIRDLCEEMVYLFKRRGGILENQPEVRFSNLSNDFRFW